MGRIWEDTAGAWASPVGVVVGAAAVTVGAPGGGLPAQAPPVQEPTVAATGGQPPLAGGGGRRGRGGMQPGLPQSAAEVPSLLSPPPAPGLRQDGGTPRLLPGRPCAPGRAAPRSLLTGPAEVGVAGLQRAPLLQEREYLPPLLLPDPGGGGAQETGGQRACLISADRKRCLAREGLAQVAGVSVPPAGPSSGSEF